MDNNQWTAHDQAQLDALQARRTEFLKANRGAVEELATLMDLHNFETTADIVEALITHADEMRDVLAPFDSGRASIA